MALWEYKVITSGQHGFASPALLEAHLNSLGKDEWEIVHFQTLPNNPLAFNGIVRRSTMRDWVPPEVAAIVQPRPSAYEPAPKAADKFDEEKPEAPPTLANEADSAKPASLRTMRNTERDNDPDAEDEAEDWDNWEDKQDELPTFFEAIKPHMRRNQKGPGNSVALDHLARRWEQREADLVGALKECGFTIAETEEADPEYFEFEGDLYWVNRNNRGQLFINSREKPRPVFRTVPVNKLSPDDPAAAELVAERALEKTEIEKRKAERIEREAAAAAATAAREAARLARQQQQAASAASASVAAAAESASAGADGATSSGPAEPLPPGAELLENIRPQMRRNRRGPGYSGSVGFLARALKQSEADLTAALAALGLHVPADANDKPVYVEIDGGVYWMNKDGRGGVWINGREKKEGSAPAAAQASGGEDGASSEESRDATSAHATVADAVEKADASATVPTEEQPSLPLTTTASASAEVADRAGEPSSASVGNSTLAGVRLLLKANKRGSGVSGEVSFLARTLGKSDEVFLGTLTDAGLVIPADSEVKPVFVEQAGEIFWLNKNSKDGSLWLNGKVAKSAAKKPAAEGAGRGTSRPRTRKPKAADAAE